MDWLTVFARWQQVELDFQEFYGIDLSEPGLLQTRSWRWLRLRLVGLLSVNRTPLRMNNKYVPTGGSRLQRALAPTPTQQTAQD